MTFGDDGYVGERRMGFYARHVLPRIIDLSMQNKEVTPLRMEWIRKAKGVVLEVGIGSGLNLPYYSSDVTQLYGVDPSRELQQMARQRAASTSRDVEFITQSAEQPIPLGSGTIDTVVTTWTLCSIPDVPLALKEVKRVLKSHGAFIFIEHGHAPDATVSAWQDRLTPLWKHIGGGCHLNRPIDTLIADAGFRIQELHTGYLPGPRPLTYTYQGFAESVVHAA